MEAIGRWWDGVELWVTGLPFALQAVVVMAVLMPVAAVLAVGADRFYGAAEACVRRGRGRARADTDESEE